MNFKEILELYNKPTFYERQHGIKIVRDWEIYHDTPDLKFYTRVTNDRRTTLLIIFRAGKTQNCVGWMINERQAATLINDFPGIYAVIEEMNNQVVCV